MYFSSQKNRIYFNEKEFATETWHLAEDSLAAVLKCFIRVSPEWWPEHLCLTLEQSSDWSPHPKVHTGAPPFSLLSLSHLLVSKTLPPLRKAFEAVDWWGSEEILRRFFWQGKHNFDCVSFHEENQYRCYPVSLLPKSRTDEHRLSRGLHLLGNLMLSGCGTLCWGRGQGWSGCCH